jgi:mannose-1-phosphate guanylyltransferase
VKAVVLVGGFGTRLRPLTLSTPKQMLPVVDRPMLDWVMERLAADGVDEAVLSLGYRPDVFTDAYPDGRCGGLRLSYAVEPEPLDTAGAIRFAALEAGLDERFVVVNGDVLTDFGVDRLWRFHEEHEAEASIHLIPVEDPSRYGVVPVDVDGRVEAFIEKPPADQAPSRWINAGTYVLEPSVVDRIPGGRKVSIERETFPTMVDEGTVYALEADEYWIDTGTPATYLQAQLDLIGGRRPSTPPAVADTASISVEADVTESVVAAEVSVGAGATVKRSALLPGAHVGVDATVEDSIVGPGAVVGRGARITGLTVLGDAVEVSDGAVLDGVRVPDPGT